MEHRAAPAHAGRREIQSGIPNRRPGRPSIEERNDAMGETEPQRILVVEDDARLADLLKRQLEAGGFEVQTASRGSTALESMDTQQPALVVLDLRLPDISGYELCVMLRQHYSHVELPIIVLTGVQRGLEELQREAAGADAYLYKPCDALEFIETVHRLLRQDPA
jgi:two-component system phosphate regulon response regulator PhoB